MKDLINDFDKFVSLEIELKKKIQQPLELVPAWNRLVFGNDDLLIDENKQIDSSNKTR